MVTGGADVTALCKLQYIVSLSLWQYSDNSDGERLHVRCGLELSLKDEQVSVGGNERQGCFRSGELPQQTRQV